LKGKLKTGDPVIDTATLNALFPQNAMEIIFQIHTQFLVDLSQRLTKEKKAVPLVGDIFVRLVRSLSFLRLLIHPCFNTFCFASGFVALQVLQQN
jgi:hypothetical protein